MIKDMFGHQLQAGDLIAALKGGYAEIGVIKPVRNKVHYYRLVPGDFRLHPWCPATEITDNRKPRIDYVNPISKRVIKLEPNQLDENFRAQYDIIYNFIKGI